MNFIIRSSSSTTPSPSPKVSFLWNTSFVQGNFCVENSEVEEEKEQKGDESESSGSEVNEEEEFGEEVEKLFQESTEENMSQDPTPQKQQKFCCVCNEASQNLITCCKEKRHFAHSN